MRFMVVAVSLAVSLLASGFARAADLPVVRVAYAKCAHCTPVSLMPEFAKGVKIDAVAFNTGSDALTALVTKNVDIAQSTYQSFVVAMDRGFDVVAISGHVNGGSQMLIGNDLPIQKDDWDGLKKLIADYKKEGKPFRVAASRGNAQDLHMRGELAAHGIDPNKDVQFVNIANPSDHLQAMRRGEAELLCTVEPFATQILQAGAAKFFNFPYDQSTGTLTGLFLTRPDVIAQRPKDVEAAVRAWLAVDDLISHDKTAWADVIVKVTGIPRSIADGSIPNLFPDRAIHRDGAQAVAKSMLDLRYINRDVSSAIDSHIDYQFLEQATGKTAAQLGK
ncbi:ABC-type nitrate/sulfonate/bicarbonate transport system, substrate-binding protein [Enhydrobacter aerosaccus]|uniref:ABC-type nitrate/sulfonate/bicarbonate transport system, substrate-binding protein n=1 Tax=Enhydrobacter aerosaccus TaxID=225324 RepID=A0A1T4PBK0_9HYPH|nr:ABC transporter substrate-binding protein [Enhydrobacter aerosaccus]SJZ88930.1 ABC-type nitrate/sulfonate/bicarbonate transport system, substrate-binding protein [Enhydrobacter aerosaccus]